MSALNTPSLLLLLCYLWYQTLPVAVTQCAPADRSDHSGLPCPASLYYISPVITVSVSITIDPIYMYITFYHKITTNITL